MSGDSANRGTPAAKLVEDVRVWVMDDRVVVLEVGEIAQLLIAAAAGWRPVHERRPMTLLYGLPVAATLDSLYGWRVLDQAGEVVAEGVIAP